MAYATINLPEGICIRSYCAADFEGMFGIVREIVSLPPYDEARRELEAYPAKGLLAFVATNSNGLIIGYCSATHPYWNRVGIIDYLVVAPDYRRRGLGARMVHEVEAAARAAGLLRLCVQTISWNMDAIRFYERLDYRDLARLPRYCDDRHDMVWMDRSLADPRATPTP